MEQWGWGKPLYPARFKWGEIGNAPLAEERALWYTMSRQNDKERKATDMEIKIGKDTIIYGDCGSTNIALGTTAEYAYRRYCEIKVQISDLEYESELLVDKYHAEMKKATIPSEFTEIYIEAMFDASGMGEVRRKIFLEKVFSKDFLESQKVEFIKKYRCGYSSYAIGIVLGIGDYEYNIECPQPQNIHAEEDKKRLVGDVKFRVNRIHKSKANEFIRKLECVKFPTYDWKECFAAIEKKVQQDEIPR